MTRRKYIPIGSTAASMPPTVTGTTMPILTNTSAVRLAKKLLPQNVFQSKLRHFKELTLDLVFICCVVWLLVKELHLMVSIGV